MNRKNDLALFVLQTGSLRYVKIPAFGQTLVFTPAVYFRLERSAGLSSFSHEIPASFNHLTRNENSSIWKKHTTL